MSGVLQQLNSEMGEVIREARCSLVRVRSGERGEGAGTVWRGILKKCVNGQAVYPLSEQHGIESQERRYTAHEEGKH